MAKRQKTGKTLVLFDVDGTLTVPRKVRRALCVPAARRGQRSHANRHLVHEMRTIARARPTRTRPNRLHTHPYHPSTPTESR